MDVWNIKEICNFLFKMYFVPFFYLHCVMKHCDDTVLKLCFDQANIRIKNKKKEFHSQSKAKILSERMKNHFLFNQDHEFSESAFMTSRQRFIFIKII